MDLSLIGDLQKQPQVLAQIKENESSLQVLPRFFNADEISYLLELKDRAYAVKDNLRFRQGGGSSKPSDVMAWPTPELQLELSDFLKSKMQNILPDNCKLEFAFHKNYHPYGLHTDAGYNQEEVIFKQGIIPLAWEPKHSKSHTIIMKQRCHFSCSFPAKSQYRVEDQAQVDAMKEKWIEDFRADRPFSQDDLKRYFGGSEYYREWLRGFEVDYPFEWKVGDTVVWDRGQIHCSSDFDFHGLEYKLGLMWVSSII